VSLASISENDQDNDTLPELTDDPGLGVKISAGNGA
jgi:hypothetical protein